MNNKGEGGILTNNLMYIILFLVFFMLMFYYAIGYQDGASVWEDFYTKEIVKIINELEPGTEVYLDVTKLTDIAFRNGKTKKEIIYFDNVENSVIVSLNKGSGTKFNFYNDVVISEPEIKLISGGPKTNQLYFKVVETQRSNNE